MSTPENEKDEKNERNENNERTTACSGFEGMFEMMSKFFPGRGGIPDCASMMLRCCGTRKP
jgi:hypothetical protein